MHVTHIHVTIPIHCKVNFTEFFNFFNQWNCKILCFKQFGFKIAAQSRFEMKPLYRKLNYLATTLAPDLDEGGGGMMRASYIKVTIGSLLNRVPGFLTSMNIKWQKDYPWEIALANPEIDNLTDTDMQALPHVLDVAVQFKPVHDFLPQKSIDKSPFIGVTNWIDGLKADPAQIEGCTNSEASNYDPNATIDDGSCVFPVEERTDADREFTVSSPTDDLGAPLNLSNAGNQSTFNYSL